MDRPPAAPDVPLDPALLELFALPLLERLCRLAEGGQRPVVALNAPVGAGKTSLCRVLAQLAVGRDLRLAVASIDDFYLPWPERSAALAGNPFGVSRVPPGSHDPDLLCAVLDHWRAGGSLQLPRFDKTCRDGEGDRSAGVVLEADALLLEGWLVGCRPLGAGLTAALAELSAAPGLNALALNAAERNWLPHWDQALRAYLPAWQRLDAVWLMRPLSWDLPRRWRFQAEARQRRRHGVGLTGAGLNQLVRASLYSLPPRLYLDPLLARLGQPVTRRWVDPNRASGLSASGRGATVEAAAWLDGRRRLRCLAVSAEAGEPGVDSGVAITPSGPRDQADPGHS
jgi:D-glycerate 3-kinase